jgi:hypothetical protein
MTRAVVYPAMAATLYVATFAQAADAPRFEGADVHASAPSTNIRDNFMQGPFAGGGRFEVFSPIRSSAGLTGPVLTVSTFSRRLPRTLARLICG